MLRNDAVRSTRWFWLVVRRAGLLMVLCAQAAHAGLIDLPQTGQKTCYDEAGAQLESCAGTGQDGELQMGIAATEPRFHDNGNGTVTDTLTGLVWLKNAMCFQQKSWLDALAISNALGSGQCGLTDNSVAGDWRLPNVLELESLIDISKYDPLYAALPADHPFINVRPSGYWTSTTNAFHPIRARYVWMPSGAVNGSDKIVPSHYLWPVRDGF
jgi:hypothetical protein